MAPGSYFKKVGNITVRYVLANEFLEKGEISDIRTVVVQDVDECTYEGPRAEVGSSLSAPPVSNNVNTARQRHFVWRDLVAPLHCYYVQLFHDLSSLGLAFVCDPSGENLLAINDRIGPLYTSWLRVLQALYIAIASLIACVLLR